jgi:GNAT superfamily N-acetyltransferase
VSVDTVLVSTPLDYAQAALLLGEQRAWTESILGHDLAEVQPSARSEYANLAAVYDPPHGRLLLARVAGEPVGIVAVRRLEDGRGEGKRLYVRRSARRSGVARGLVHALLPVARALGFRALYIETSPHKTGAAYEWYRRLAFRETTKLNFTDLDQVVAMESPLR